MAELLEVHAAKFCRVRQFLKAFRIQPGSLCSLANLVEFRQRRLCAVQRKDSGIVMEADDNRRADVEFVLAALGRRTNIDRLGLAEAGIEVNANGVPRFDANTMQAGDLPVFLAGDVNGSRQLMHEAVDEGVIAGFNAARVARNPEMKAQAFARKTPLAIAFTDPDLVVVGASLSELDPKQIVIGSAEGQGNGRTRILHEPRSILRVYADKADGRLLGAAMLAPRAEHLAHLLALAIGRGETAASLLQMPFYHPVMEEMLQSALQEAARQLAGSRDLPLGLPPI